jgi:hypothetical protein
MKKIEKDTGVTGMKPAPIVNVIDYRILPK